jgi:hypothetical protein
MKSDILRNLARFIRAWARASSAGYLKLVILAAILFAWAYVAEFRLIIGLESSQGSIVRFP